MNHKIFYSWQDDKPGKLCRNFIEGALEKAIQEIAKELIVESAERPATFEIDKDTKGVSGTPPIVDTIFAKIDDAVAFVADCTFVGKRDNDERPIPNPNVLIEYGWALKSRTHLRVIGIMNAAYGKPDDTTLPFNMKHLRWPITYHLAPDADEAEVRNQRANLVKILKVAIKAILDNPKLMGSPMLAEPAKFASARAQDGSARFHAKDAPLGIIDGVMGIGGGPLKLAGGPARWLRIMPTFQQDRTWKISELRNLSTGAGRLFPPLNHVHFSGFSYFRGPDGFGICESSSQASRVTQVITFLFTTGEVWGIDATSLSSSDGFAVSEQGFVDFFKRGVQFLSEDLKISPPYRWIAGIEGIRDRYFYRPDPPGRRYISSKVGPCMLTEIIVEGLYKKPEPIHLSLRPFFEAIYDSCGVERPAELDATLK
jgi:hypothetical protein